MVRLYLGGGPTDGPTDITHHETWLALKPHLSAEARYEVEAPSDTINLATRGGGKVRVEVSPVIESALEAAVGFVDDRCRPWCHENAKVVQRHRVKAQRKAA